MSGRRRQGREEATPFPDAIQRFESYLRVTRSLPVHQQPYYESAGTRCWPNDHSPPVPITFLSVRPPARLLVTLSGPEEWTERAEQLLLVAMAEWGVGAKTSSGYGRLTLNRSASAGPAGAGRGGVLSESGPAHLRGSRITVTRVEDPKGRGRSWFRAPDGRLGHFAGADAPSIDVGATVEVCVANVSSHGYMLTLKQPRRGSSGRGSPHGRGA